MDTSLCYAYDGNYYDYTWNSKKIIKRCRFVIKSKNIFIVLCLAAYVGLVTLNELRSQVINYGR